MSLLVADTTGAIVQIHGTLRKQAGLILASSQYRDLGRSPAFEYWRNRMFALFQMQRVIVLGYSLTDPHVRAVLEVARRGSRANQPVCLIAPDVNSALAEDYLQRYRIRLIPYPMTDDHEGPTRSVDTISEFVVPREGVRIRPSWHRWSNEDVSNSRPPPRCTCSNRLAPHVDLDALRLSVAMGAIESALPQLRGEGAFSVSHALGRTSSARRASLSTEPAD